MKDRWEDCDVDTQAKLLAYNQLAEHDAFEQQVKLAGAKLM